MALTLSVGNCKMKLSPLSGNWLPPGTATATTWQGHARIRNPEQPTSEPARDSAMTAASSRKPNAAIASGMKLALGLAFALLAACVGDDAVPPATAAAPSQAKPNVIVILADDLGFNDISANGGRIPTPNIDALAASGTRYTSGYVTAAVCAPSRAALMAGRQQTRFGYEFNPVQRDTTGGVSLGETTIAQTMKQAGYRTGIVGKWHRPARWLQPARSGL